MSLNPTGLHFRSPSHVSGIKPMSASEFQAPLEELFLGDWYMIRSSNAFWKDKRNIRLSYTQSASYVDDRAFYQTMNSDAVKSMDGKNISVDGAVGIYNWQGKGLLRVVNARWEILCFTSRPSNGDWMLVFMQKSLFTSPSVHLLCRQKGGISETDMKQVEEWLPQVQDEKFQQAVKEIADIRQE
ncbi:hypothetical protein GQ43DRAFT_445009 [Delitschia confertaspora ATCC 74209]|uniref:Uncharacterized protein n=1 Tax=Delitschia confertaspora ATCC 74209 TaxID=1513339 RepID=A0A9P4JBQ5_9PLEO|nr:hypothetical protein GQ43DRAFT_445009 [Delitschia confertaspora ATCC 74209]